MGFLPEETIYKLVFDDTALNGLEVRARSIPVGTLTMLTTLSDRVGAVVPGKFTSQQMGAVDELLQGFASALVDWNLERRNSDGNVEAVPASIEGIRTQDPVLMMTIVKGWFDAVGGIAAPLGDSSTSGEPFPEGSLPMEALSPSLASLPMPA